VSYFLVSVIFFGERDQHWLFRTSSIVRFSACAVTLAHCGSLAGQKYSVTPAAFARRRRVVGAGAGVADRRRRNSARSASSMRHRGRAALGRRTSRAGMSPAEIQANTVCWSTANRLATSRGVRARPGWLVAGGSGCVGLGATMPKK
jgi:hypothetical protein